jgi:PIN domain nuclease of toxin-antitoxin system
MKILVDTCAIVWAIADPKLLSKAAKKQLLDPDNTIYYSPISAAEIACAVMRGRLKLDRHWKLWFRHFTGANGWDPIDIDLPIVEEAYSLADKFHGDPTDRILVATSRMYSCHLITADKKILAYPHVESIW